MKLTIAVDCMGGDNAPLAPIKGVSRYAHRNKDVRFLLCGDESAIGPYLRFLNGVDYSIIHTDFSVSSSMEVLTMLRAGKQSSMGVAITAVKEGKADAVVSSGNTGMYMALSKVILNTVSGIERPAIASVMPGLKNESIFLDLGANSDCSSKNLLDFAILGQVIAKTAFHKDDIKIALLNIGEESNKGNRIVKEADKLLNKYLSGYVGFIESDMIMRSDIDVIVTDGFTGNMCLKAIEGCAKYITSVIKSEINDSLLVKFLSLFALPTVYKLKKRFDPRMYNGALIAGLNGIVIKSHGNSDEVGFANALRFAVNLLETNIPENIKNITSSLKDQS